MNDGRSGWSGSNGGGGWGGQAARLRLGRAIMGHIAHMATATVPNAGGGSDGKDLPRGREIASLAKSRIRLPQLIGEVMTDQ